MRQVIHPDPFKLDDWDFAAADRVFVTLVHAKDWKTITGEAAPNQPPTAKEYSDAGLPWFEHYGKDQAALPGSVKLAGVKSVAKLFKKFTGATLPNSEDVETGSPKPSARARRVLALSARRVRGISCRPATTTWPISRSVSAGRPPGRRQDRQAAKTAWNETGGPC